MAADFQFIAIQSNGHVNDKAMRRQARSHAIRKALERRRKEQQRSRTNFIVTTFQDPSLRFKLDQAVEAPKSFTRTSPSPPAPTYSALCGALDPFQTLAVNSARLQALLGDYRARQAPEPVFSVAEELAFQSFRLVFRTGFQDPALINSVMLALAFAAAGGSLDRECLQYQGQAITYLRERMNSEDEAASEATIGAILLIAGVVARLGLASQVELHMGAVQQLLQICHRKNVHLTPGIERAVFWQDLNSSLLAGSRRIVSHTTFSTLLWTRDDCPPGFYRLPPGFQCRSHMLDHEFSVVLEDLHALQCIRNIPRPRQTDATRMLHINNHTASIQSRLMALSGLSRSQECCRLAACLCSMTLCCKIWSELVLPSHISSLLLCKLREVRDDVDATIWHVPNSDLLVWLLYIGGAFAPRGPIRSGYVELLVSYANGSWSEVHDCMRQFIWSDGAFLVPVRALWREVKQSYLR
ncbi:uncharacterized protein BP01DRAFT_349483 [Aspergillus saccharolyticus JOP 1030-1]|uniref:Transcription factor domain-containing protein n=1 Tax=Aspergillus saccharolyticus JOP 1030-1 TaxID=1450539 RepID=A0A318ZM16_9EURO|nr:hypothetical protein BP01DRAFT_349483 [Aspergillus saccharolyticus JOP 1030-1]PYH41298.1 hypothetical protein BP01DRAFT_349483 [Aspergillus saccharolyticus JOP 1030-1]